MADAGARADRKLIVFISYSRADVAFAEAIVDALKTRDFDVLIDRRDLPYGEEWKPELLDFVRQSDAVVFVVSAHSVGSRWCKWELEQVTAESKRLIPITLEGVPVENLPPEIGEIHLLPFTQAWDGGRGPGFIAQVEILAKVLLTDHAWVKAHTRLGELARRWQAARAKDGDVRAEALLLRGDPALSHPGAALADSAALGLA
jgi:TIR domain-containing protein